MITASELAELEGCSIRWIRKKANNGDYVYKEETNELNKKVFMFPVAELPRDIKEKYYSNLIADTSDLGEAKVLTLKEREEVDFWIDIIKQWQHERNHSPLKFEEVDECFVGMMKLKHPQYTFSRRILYRKWRYYKNREYDKLLDNRGKHNKGRTKVTVEMRNIYLSYFMEQAQYPLIKCYEFMKMEISKKYPEQYDMIPTARTMHRDLINGLPVPLQILGRQGKKAYDDICGYYIRREYKDMESNDYWIGDTHTLDIMSADEGGKVHRLYLNAWMDARSGVMVGWYITANPSSQATVYALRDAILRRNAIPRNVYVDNGREYLTHDVGGLGHRARKSQKDEFKAPPIFNRLGIEMTNALVRNARAKTIERRFLDFKNQVSRLFSTYTGGSVAEKPEILKTRLKNGQVIIEDELKENINTIIEYYFNYSTYNGEVSADKGKRKIDVYNEHQVSVRRASKEELELMLLRSSRPQKVGRRGVQLKFNGEKFDYFSKELHNMFSKEVYFRYDPDDLSEVRIYDLEDRYLMTVPCADETVLKYNSSKEDVKNAMKILRKVAKEDLEVLKAIKAMGTTNALDLVLEEAERNRENPAKSANPKILEIHRADEGERVSEIIKDASGFEYEIDTEKMLRNIELKNKQEVEDV